MSAGGGKHVERYRLRDGVRIGGGPRAELVNARPDDQAARDLLLRQTRQIGVLYRQWSRRRSDVDALDSCESLDERLHGLTTR